MTPEQRIDAALDSVLKASGSALRHYTMPKTLADMREAMRKVMFDEYIKWQPIETAPTDGTRILLRGMGGKIADGHYGQPDGWVNPKRFVWPYINATPTHWAPLALIAAAPELLDAAMKVNALTQMLGMED